MLVVVEEGYQEEASHDSRVANERNHVVRHRVKPIRLSDASDLGKRMIVFLIS